MILSKTQKLILSKSLEKFSHHGYKSTTISMIAEACELNELTIYRNFNTKEQLFNQTLSYCVSKMDIPDSFSNFEHLPIQQFLQKIGDFYLKLCIENIDLYKIQLLTLDNLHGFEKLVLTNTLISHFEKSLENYNKKQNCNHDTNALARLFFSSILGCFTVYVLNDSIVAFEQLQILKNLQVDAFIQTYYGYK